MSARRKIPLAAECSLLLLAILIGCALIFTASLTFYRAAYPIGYGEIVERESRSKELPPALVYAVIRTESGFNPAAQSSLQARGLMQITRDTFEWAQFRMKEERTLHFDDLFESEENIRYGTAILRLLLDEFDTETNALCAYHAGWGNAKKWLNNPEYAPDGRNIERIPFGDTAKYVEKVLTTKKTYEALYHLDGKDD